MKLVKEIKNKNGFTLFKRWRVLNLYFIYLDIHEFFLPEDSKDLTFDKDHFLHNHPRVFVSMILDGGYEEEYKSNKNSKTKIYQRKKGSINFIGLKCFHRIKKLFKPYCKTLILTTKNIKDWGYLTESGEVISNEKYRELKASGFYKNQTEYKTIEK